MTAAQQRSLDLLEAERTPDNPGHLTVGVAEAGCQRGNIDGVADGLVTRGVDYVPQRLLGVLDAASLRVSVPQEDELLLLARPQSSDALSVEFDHPEAEVPLVEHDDLVLVRPVVHHVPERQQRLGAGEDGVSPGWVALVANHEALLVAADGLVQHAVLLVLVWAHEVVLVQLQTHPNCWGHHSSQQLHIEEDPLVPLVGDTEIT